MDRSPLASFEGVRLIIVGPSHPIRNPFWSDTAFLIGVATALCKLSRKTFWGGAMHFEGGSQKRANIHDHHFTCPPVPHVYRVTIGARTLEMIHALIIRMH